jgi:heme-degrading monooxygenase HmoA
MRTQSLLRLALSLRGCALAASVALVACGQAPPDTSADMPPDTMPAPQTSECSREVLEPDLVPSPFSGAGIDAMTGTLAAPRSGRYTVSTTYLTLKPGAEVGQRFGALMGPIMTQLKMQRGLAAFSLASSQKCGTARTLAVWEDETSMYEFVASPAHMSAISAVGEISRGQSLVHHYTETDAARAIAWSAAAAQLKPITGPLY